MMIKKRIQNEIEIGQVFQNPRKGTSTIVSMTDKNITYRRGQSNLIISFDNVEKVYEAFNGKTCRTSDLRELSPTVFDSSKNGHGCHCTFLFSVFHHLGLASEIKGKGVRGDSYYVEMK